MRYFEHPSFIDQEPMPSYSELFTLRILDNGRTIGTGFLVAKDLAVTCAHVIANPGETIRLQLTRQEEILSARVLPGYYRGPKNGDIAFLRLRSLPENISPLPLGMAEYSSSGNPFQAFGYPTVGAVEGIYARGEILGMVMENGQRLLQLRSAELNQGHSGAPVWDEKRGVVVGIVVSVYKADISGKLRDTAFAIPSETLWQVCPEISPSETAPYLGLETFTEETAQFFFGREALTEKLLTVLRGGNRFLAVFGPSGSGKSSGVRAGLLPALKKGQLSGSQKWAQITMRPADNPFEQMQDAGLGPIDVNQYLESHTNLERVVLFIDQFEELFTLCPDELRVRFVRDLATALESSRLILILSMRDDFYSAFNAKAPPLAESEHLKVENVPGILKRGELVAMIERPAEMVGLILEDGLTELIIKDLTREGEAQSSTLPLLEFALTQLWEKRRDGQLTHEAYQTIGGVTGSLARWADDAYSNLPKADQALAEGLLTSLIQLGDEAQGLPDTRRRRTLSGYDNPIQRAIKFFTDRRLIVTSGETVELIHDALVREWGRLRSWIERDRRNLRLRQGVIEAARQWASGRRDESLLTHRGGRLEDALLLGDNTWYGLSDIERTYLNACVALRNKEQNERERRLRWTVMASIVAAMIFVILGGFGLVKSRESATQAKIALARQLAAQAWSVQNEDPLLLERSMLLAIEAKKQGEQVGLQPLQANQVLQQGLDLLPKMVTQTKVDAYDFPRRPYSDFTFSSDNKYAIVADNTIRSLNLVTTEEYIPIKYEASWRAIAFSSDGKYAATVSESNLIQIWDLKSGQELAQIPYDQEIIHIYLSSGRRYVIAQTTPTRRQIWKLSLNEQYTQIEAPSLSAFLTWEGEYWIDKLPDQIRVWSMANGKERANLKLATQGMFYDLAISSGSKYLVTYALVGTIAQVWQLPEGAEILRIVMRAGERSTPFVFSPDERYLAVVSDNQTARVWELSSRAEVLRIKVSPVENIPAFGTVRFYSVAFSPDGQYLAVTGAKLARVYRVSSGEEVKRIVYDDEETEVRNAIFSSDGRYLALATVGGISDSTLQIWELNKQSITDPIEGWVNSISISTDGKYIAANVNADPDRNAVLQIYDTDNRQAIISTTMTQEDFLSPFSGSLLSPANLQIFSPDGRYVAVRSSIDTIRIIELISRQEIATIHDNEPISDFYVFSTDNRYLLTLGSIGIYESVVKTWDIHNGKLIKSARILVNRNEIADNLLISPDGQHYLEFGRIINFDLNSEYGYLSLRTINNDEEVKLIKLDADFQLHNVLFSRDGKQIAGIGYYFFTGADTRSSRFIKIWDVLSGNEIISLTLERDARGIALSPDGRYLSVALIDGTYRVWDISSKSEIIRISNKQRNFFMTFTSDGSYLATIENIENPDGTSNRGVIQLWSLQPEKDACDHLNRNLTLAEWQQYIGEIIPYQAVCPNLPIEVVPTSTP